MNKKLLTGLSLTLALSSSLFAFTACAGDDEHEHTYGIDNSCTVCGNEWEYTKGLTYELISETDTYELTTIGMVTIKKITIPYYYEEKLVTSIGDYAFERQSEITDITIPESVTNIGVRAFAKCSKLESITIPKNVTSIGSWAFSGCSQLEKIKIPDSVTYVGWNAFSECYQLIETKNGVQYVDKWAIDCEETVTSVTLSNTNGIAGMAFESCSELTRISIPKSVKGIGFWAFMHCGKLSDITFNGTKTQWQAIKKESSWDYDTGNYTIHCIDGDIAK